MKARLVAAAACSLLMTHAVEAAEIRVLAAGAVKEAFLELIPQFESTSGNMERLRRHKKAHQRG
jgi:ABC-type molybdate transport system substrate-binding protein